MSRQSEKPSAMLAGFGRTKRVVLRDTLLERFPEDKIEADIANELGHQVRRKIWRSIAFSAVAGFLTA